jgi:peptidyl-prolyl cis-trans isomerase A (cyclophilin A)
VKAGRFLLDRGGDQAAAEWALDEANLPYFTMRDQQGTVRMELTFDAGQHPALIFRNEKGRAVKTYAAPGFRPDRKSRADAAGKGKNVRVKFETSLGDFVVELDEEKAPITAKNFLAYVDDKFYDGTIFHRVISTFMIQGGGFTRDMNPFPKETKSPIQNESSNGLSNKRGTLAMARTDAPHTATSQFFINVVDNDRLDYPKVKGSGYAVFGKVVEGMDTVDKIRNTAKSNQGGPFTDAPVTPVVIKSARRVK